MEVEDTMKKWKNSYVDSQVMVSAVQESKVLSNVSITEAGQTLPKIVLWEVLRRPLLFDLMRE